MTFFNLRCCNHKVFWHSFFLNVLWIEKPCGVCRKKSCRVFFSMVVRKNALLTKNPAMGGLTLLSVQHLYIGCTLCTVIFSNPSLSVVYLSVGRGEKKSTRDFVFGGGNERNKNPWDEWWRKRHHIAIFADTPLEGRKNKKPLITRVFEGVMFIPPLFWKYSTSVGVWIGEKPGFVWISTISLAYLFSI